MLIIDLHHIIYLKANVRTIVMKEVKEREMVKGTLPVNSLSRGITPIVASVLQSKAQHLVFTKGLFTCFVRLTIMMELLVTVLRGLGGASSIFFPLCTQLIWKEVCFRLWWCR